MQGDKRPRAASADGAQSPQKILPVALDGGAGIFPGESQIQRPASISFGNAAGPCAEAVDEPGNRLKRSSLQDFALRPAGNFQRHRNILAMSLPSVTHCPQQIKRDSDDCMQDRTSHPRYAYNSALRL
jgi:hypothetical protein